MVTTVLELAGSLILIVAAGLYVSQWTLPGSLAVVGVSLIVLSLLMTWLSNRRAR